MGKIQALPWNEFMQLVLGEYEVPQRAPNTRAMMTRVLRWTGQLKAEDGSLLVTSSACLGKRSTIAAYITHKSKTANANTILGQLSYLRTACGYAFDEGLSPRNPFGSKKLKEWIRPVPPLKRGHTPRVMSRYLDHLDAEYRSSWTRRRLRALAYVLGLSGLRKDEALYLQLEDVRLDDQLLLVSERRPWKTPKSAQPVPMTDELLQVMREWLPEAGPTYVFPTVDRDKPWVVGSGESRPTGRLRRSAAKIGITGMTALSLRHSCASLLEARGLPEIVIQRILRHTRPLTQRSYRHPDVIALVNWVKQVSYRQAG